MLNDISHLGSWDRVHLGLIKLYQGEVLGKLQVVQHTLFGSLFPFKSSTGGGETRAVMGAGGVMAGMAAPRPGMGPGMPMQGSAPWGPSGSATNATAASMANMAAPWAKPGRGAAPGVTVNANQSIFTRVHATRPVPMPAGSGTATESGQESGSAPTTASSDAPTNA